MRTALSLRHIQAIVIGTSAGAIASLSRLLPSLAQDFPLAIMVAVHVPADQPHSISHLLQAKCRIMVKEAEDKEPILPGTVYFAPPDYHLLVEADHRLSLSNEEPVNFSRPSIDVLFESAADVYRENLLALVLTGANHDGAEGARRIGMAGGLVWVQTPDSATARMMPDSALAACPTAEAFSLADLTDLLVSRGRMQSCQP